MMTIHNYIEKLGLLPHPEGGYYRQLYGNDISAFHRLHGTESEMQVVIMPEQWFAAEIPSKQGFCLVGCAVGPAFSFENFELAKKADLLHIYPQHKELIERLTK